VPDGARAALAGAEFVDAALASSNWRRIKYSEAHHFARSEMGESRGGEGHGEGESQKRDDGDGEGATRETGRRRERVAKEERG